MVCELNAILESDLAGVRRYLVQVVERNISERTSQTNRRKKQSSVEQSSEYQCILECDALVVDASGGLIKSDEETRKYWTINNLFEKAHYPLTLRPSRSASPCPHTEA